MARRRYSPEFRRRVVELVDDLEARGMTAPVVAVGDGALSFWTALSDVFPQTREQRCWVHKIANILDALPKRPHRTAKAALHEIYQAETRTDADVGIDRFDAQFGDKYPKAVDKLSRDRDVLLTFYDFPAAPLGAPANGEPDRIDVRHRAAPHQGHQACRQSPPWPHDGLQAARRRPGRWRKVNSPELVAPVRASIEFKDGIQTERSIEDSRDAA